ncbi:MAG: hypothetical protein ACR2O4_08410 [Hyphomicrobiaceae bacterium]
MNWKRLLKWVVGVPVVLITLWIGVLFWFNEVRYHFRSPSPALAAAQTVAPEEYKCPEPPIYHRIEDRLKAKGSDIVKVSDVMAVWTVEMSAFEICNRKYLVPALKQQAAIEAALEEPLAISQRDGLYKKRKLLDKHLVPAKRMAKRARGAKAMWIDGEWPRAFLDELKTKDPYGYRLLTHKDPDE